MIIFFVILIILLLAIFSVSVVLILKTNKEIKIRTIETLEDLLESKCFNPAQIVMVNRHLSLAINKTYSKLVLIKNFNPNNPQYYDYEEIATSFINSIEKKGYSIKINYTKKAQENTLSLYPVNKELKAFVHEIFQYTNLRRIEEKFSDYKFSLVSSSDWKCSYTWAYCPLKTTLAYYKSTDKTALFKINLYKEHFTIDTKYNYFVVPIMGLVQQMLIYDNEFLSELFESLLKAVKNKASAVKDDMIYYDTYSNVVFLTNGATSMQSLNLDKVKEVYYRDNQLEFSLSDEDNNIVYNTTPILVREFKEFVTGYNLRTIANGFDYKTDKLINATQNTKFIVDITRDRVVYCANLNSLAKFSYLTISFSNIKDVQVEKTGMIHFVRIYTFDNEVYDVTCDKKEIAYYILASLQSIIKQ